MSSGFTFANCFTVRDPAQDLLGSGGMGKVYRATDAQTGEIVAIKVLSPAALARDPGLLERFVREGVLGGNWIRFFMKSLPRAV